MQSSHDNSANKESVIVLSCSLHHRLHSQMTALSCVVDCCIVWQPNVTSLHTLNTGTPSSHHLLLVWLIVAYLSACVVDCCISTNAKTTPHTPIWLPRICGFTICTHPPPEHADSIANGR